MRLKSSFNKCNDLDLNEIKSDQWQDKETDSLTAFMEVYLQVMHLELLVVGSSSFAVLCPYSFAPLCRSVILWA